ncbi:MAG TPA: FtsH protease activity modulator HflK, partial [Candidatus Binatia bacterium]|nr:FtsH protease activity modulator HflK [Candidatus Binatia bacterium]
MKSANNPTDEFIANLAKGKKWFFAAFWLLLAGFLGWTAYYTVPADSIAVVQRFGKYIGTTEPGLHFKIPGGVDKVTLLPVRRQQKLEFGYGTPKATNPYQDSNEPDKEQDMVTGDLNSARVEWVVQYRIEDPKEYLFATSDPEETLRAASEAIMRQVVGDRTIDEVVTFGRQDIENSCLPLLQQVVKQYQLGLRVDLVQLKNINPPQPVQASFDDVNNAQQEKQRDINQATGEYNSIIPRARGQADQSIAEANGYAAKRINEATGDADYFTGLFEQYSKAPEVTRERMYLETMSDVIPRMGQKIIVDAQAAKMMPFLMPLQRDAAGLK